MRTGLDDRLVCVTGAGRGLGLTLARALAAEGAHVVVAEIDAERAEAAASQIDADGGKATAVATDVADEASVASLAERIATVGPLWGLVNSAGLADAVGGPRFEELTVEEWDRLMAVNARGPWLVSKWLLPALHDGGDGGRIVHLASDAALHGSPRLSHYIASKGAVLALTRAMARELGDEGITVNALAPGLTESPSTERVPTERHQLYARNRAISRPQQPDDLAGAALFLLSDSAAYVTGQCLVVDGGFVMP
jgi:NAD(P)-dependent dehydrogenase (short-subunit alcohol dehydrogenase family)